MKKKLFFFAVIFSLIIVKFACTSDRSKANLSSTIQICDKNLLVEKYTISSGGAYGGDRVSDYLTDSRNFRMYVGTFDNAHENYTYLCRGDSIYIEKLSIEEEGIPYNTKSIVKTIEKKAFALKTLRKLNKFD